MILDWESVCDEHLKSENLVLEDEVAYLEE